MAGASLSIGRPHGRLSLSLPQDHPSTASPRDTQALPRSLCLPQGHTSNISCVLVLQDDNILCGSSCLPLLLQYSPSHNNLVSHILPTPPPSPTSLLFLQSSATVHLSSPALQSPTTTLYITATHHNPLLYPPSIASSLPSPSHKSHACELLLLTGS